MCSNYLSSFHLFRADRHALSLHFGEQYRDLFRNGLKLILQLPH